MGNKRNTYVLLIVVLAIWGIIGYRVLKTLNPSQEESAVTEKGVSFHPEKLKKQESFTIAVQERDPFLGTMTRPQKKKAAKPAVREEMPPEMEVPVYYFGMVKDGKSREKIYFVQIDGMQQLMRIHDEVKGVKLLKGSEQEITVLYNGKRKVIPING